MCELVLVDRCILPPTQFSYRRDLEMCNSLQTFSQHIQVAYGSSKRGGLFSCTSQLHLIGLVTAVCCTS